MEQIRETLKPTMTEEEMIKDYPRLKREYTCVERMLNIAVNVDRSTAPPLLPNVC